MSSISSDVADHIESTDARTGDSLLSDRFGRQVTYLRISITDRCNFRCVYCSPAEGIEHSARPELLTYEEIQEAVEIFAEHGVRKVRITGGEPLVRADVPELVGRLSGIEGIEHVAMTTNAFLLGRHARALRDAGLNSINISLDSLDAENFEELTRIGGLDRVLEGIDAAQREDFDLIKLNTVVIRGFNDDEILELVRFAAEKDLILRFIEFMPLGQETVWTETDETSCVPASEIRAVLRSVWDLSPDEERYGSGPAKYWRVEGPGLPEDGHTIGLIGAVTECFCENCNRMRMTPKGKLRACLADDREISVRTPLRTLAEPAERRAGIEEAIARALGGKKATHDFDLEGDSVTHKAMTAIGG